MTDLIAALQQFDPTTVPFWEAALRHELVLQRCTICGTHQLPPRPFCLACESDSVDWVTSPGIGTVYSTTVVRIPVLPELEPPYTVGVVELNEGPRMTGHVRGNAPIGTRVQLSWLDHDNAIPTAQFISLEIST